MKIGILIKATVAIFFFASGALAQTVPQGRATLTSGTPVTTTDVSGATSIHYALAAGNQVPIYNGSTLVHTTFSEITLALDSNSGHAGYHQSGKIFDLFVIDDNGTLRFCSGPAWLSDATRGTGVGTTELQLNATGLWSNKVTLSNCRFGSSSGNTVSVSANRGTYVASFRASADGQATDSQDKRWLFNAYNQTPRSLRRGDPAALPYTYTGTWRQCNGSDSNRVDVLLGLDGGLVSVRNIALADNQGTSLASVNSGIGINGVAPHADTSTAFARLGAGSATHLPSTYDGHPGLGRHYFTCLEQGHGSGTQNWYPNGFSNDLWTGLFGKVIM